MNNFTNPNLTSEKKFQQNEIIGKEYTMEEFGAILKNVGLTREIFDSLSRIKGFEKLTDAIEFFFKLVKEKNEQIFILEKEIEDLNYKNFDLNKKNMELEEKLQKLEKITNTNFEILNEYFEFVLGMENKNTEDFISGFNGGIFNEYKNEINDLINKKPICELVKQVVNFSLGEGTKIIE